MYEATSVHAVADSERQDALQDVPATLHERKGRQLRESDDDEDGQLCLVVDLLFDVVFRAKQAPELHDDDEEHEEDLHNEGRDSALLEVRTDVIYEDTCLCLCQHEHSFT